VLRQGKACLWAGDIWNGTSADGTRNIINNLDITRHYVPMRSTTGYLVGSYMFEDVNMDGIIDDGDSAFVIYNGKQNTQSPLYFCIKRP